MTGAHRKVSVSNLSFDDVVALNALIVTAIGLTFFLSRKDRKTPSLDLSGPRRATALDEISPLKKQTVLTGSTYGATALKKLEEEDAIMAEAVQIVRPSRERDLNVFFNWNGHTWDAFEVLGCPAGASREAVVQAFHQARAKSPDSTPFLQAATDAILKRR